MQLKYICILFVILIALFYRHFFFALSELAFKSEVDYIIKHQREREIEIEWVMNNLIQSLSFTCSEGDRELLQSSFLSSRYILIKGLDFNGEICTSLGSQLNLELKDIIDKSSSVYAVENKKYFQLGDFQDSTQKLMITYHYNNAVLFVILNAGSIYNLLDDSCNRCLLIEFVAGNETILKIGDENIKNEEGKFFDSFMSLNGEMKISIFAGKKLIENVSLKVFNYLKILVIFIIITIFIFLFYFRVMRDNIHAKIKNAIMNKDFIPFYQPIFSSTENKIVGVEVLIRWNDDGCWISPEKFIPYAEENGLIFEITDILLEKVLSDLNDIPVDLWLSINISAKHFEASYLHDLLINIKPEYARRISLEITERHPIKDVNDAANKIAILHSNGFAFKLDDFGTGYGGIAYLQVLGVRSFKIDKMFINTIGTEDFKVSVLDSIIAFGIESGYEMIAEGVETTEQVDFLTRKGVFLHQGYFYAKPMPLNEFFQYIKMC